MNITESGEWVAEHRYDSNRFSITMGGENRQFERGGFPEKIDIIEENGIVTEVGFFYETTNAKEYLEDFRYLMTDLTFAFVEGEQNYNVFNYKKWESLKTQIEESILGDDFGYANINQRSDIKDFSFTIDDVEISCNVELKGYELWQNEYVAKEGEETYYSVSFSVKK